jgi:choline dehydrogenase-like flavoprotein
MKRHVLYAGLGLTYGRLLQCLRLAMIDEWLDGLDDSTHDICIVGSGPAGISLALQLERFGLSVLMLESGSRAREAANQDLSSADFPDSQMHYEMDTIVSRQLGGTSNLWGGRCVPFDPIDFASRPTLVDEGWPFTYEELLPYYDGACRYAHSGAPIFSLPTEKASSSDDDFTCAALERWSSDRRMHVAHQERLTNSRLIDIRLRVTATGMNFTDAGRVHSIDVVRSDGNERRRIRIRKLVLAAGGLETTRLLLAAQRHAPERFGGRDGALGRYYMGHVTGIIADIVFQNPELDAELDFFMDDGVYARRRFVPSFATQLREQILNVAMWPIIPKVADPTHGNGILSLSYLALSLEKLGGRLVPELIRKRHAGLEADRGLHLRNVLRDLPHTVAFVPNFLWRRYISRPSLPGLFLRDPDHRYRLFYHSEQSPNPDSRVTLTDTLDRTGLPKLLIDLRVRDEDAHSVVRVHELFSQWLLRSGEGTLNYRMPRSDRVSAVLAQARHGSHQIGTARIGKSRATAVVDKDLRAFDSPNLFAVSSAVLPTSSQANPTLTTMALALRLADTLVREHAHERHPAAVATIEPKRSMVHT